MQLNDAVYVLGLPTRPDDPAALLHLTLVLDATHGPTLIDTGLPGQRVLIANALAEAGLGIGDLRRIIITHQDIDHIGSLYELVQLSGAQVLAHRIEAPFIDGTSTPRFLTPAALEQHPQLRAVADRFQPTPVDQLLEDGALLDLAGGLRVVLAPGHTPGHLCLYHEPSQTLITGDALTASAGRLQGPNQSATPDLSGAWQSVRKLAELPVQTIVCYHGGVVADDAAGQLRQLAQQH